MVGLSVENPILRKPIREDIYAKAAQLKMLNTPGAAVEDRQYSITFNNVSIVTGNWNEISQFLHPANVRFKCNCSPTHRLFFVSPHFCSVLI